MTEPKPMNVPQVSNSITDEGIPRWAVVMDQSPMKAIEQAKLAATALTSLISQKKKPVFFNGEQYLEFEDWQVLAHFYGLNVKIVETHFIELDGASGFMARAVVLHRASGMEISAADAMCLDDEPNWKPKALFQLRSMAQTRAGAKAFRNVLSWVAVIAGYRPTPAEEMESASHHVAPQSARPMQSAPAATSGEANMAEQVTTWLLKMNNGDLDAANAQLRSITEYKDKKTGELKFLTLDALPRIAEKLPNWMEKIHKTVGLAHIQSIAKPSTETTPDEGPYYGEPA